MNEEYGIQIKNIEYRIKITGFKIQNTEQMVIWKYHRSNPVSLQRQLPLM